jgi:ATP-dependent exoDNAse (exonuclease V) beta subunit
MSSLWLFPVTDEQDRGEALDPRRSFIVQAPAGSGKTELLIQRYLKLLGVVEKPERIFAMTFTRKAAAEMRERILGALSRNPEAVLQPHEQITHELAMAALKRNTDFGWGLLENPARIRVQTIDALCGSLVAQMPWLARQGALPEIVDDAMPLYRSAAQRTVLMVEQETRHSEWIEHLLLHLDNKTGRVAQLIAAMLAKRDQWIELVHQVDDSSREVMEGILEKVVREAYQAIERLLSPSDLRTIRQNYGSWDVAWIELLTKNRTWRKTFTKSHSDLHRRLDAVEGLVDNLAFVEKLPPRKFTDAQWRTLRSLLEVLKLALGQLKVTFREADKSDFCEMTIAARYALGHAGDPTDLALKLDARIDHLLVDEFQDTSTGQFEILRSLIEGWEQYDGRTLFVVGDPMQSIYRFRQAEVGLFLETAGNGIGSLRPEPLVLRANYRSASGIVEWVNRVFGRAFPSRDDAPTGAVTYSPSDATLPERQNPVVLHGFPEKDREREALRVVELVREAHAENPDGTVAILVRARTHLPAIVEAIKNAGLNFRAVKIDDLGQRQVARDLLSLTRAMLHLGDRVAWLAVLRAPWCGLTLADLHALAGSDPKALVWDLMNSAITHLGEEAQQRLSRTRQIIGEALQQRGRFALRVWIENTWRALGGAACLQSSGEVKDSIDFLDLLEREQRGADLPDFDGFQAMVNQLKAQADPRATEKLQLMTIHEAKGLQFDTVILPGLGRGSGRESTELFLYHEGLMAPIQESGGDKDEIYQYLREIDKKKTANELVRLLYVACTRAKSRLHLLGFVTASNGKPPGNSLLAVLWKGMDADERQIFVDAAHGPTEEEKAAGPQPSLRRLPLAWRPPEAVPPVKWSRPEERAELEREPTFEWVGDNLRHAGTVVHAILQRLARNPAYQPAAGVIRQSLAQLGVPRTELEATATRVRQAISCTLASPRGQWILSPHQDSRCELSVAARVDGQTLSGRIDRTFIDSSGTRWIVDFKTSWHEGGGLDRFLDEQHRRYREQLEHYGRLFAAKGAPVRLGLYFPLLDAWREWPL